MVFNPNVKRLSEAIKESSVEKRKVGINVPTNIDHGNTKPYTFTMKPSTNREKLNKIVEKYGYVS
jgi:hypothetical protein